MIYRALAIVKADTYLLLYTIGQLGVLLFKYLQLL